MIQTWQLRELSCIIFFHIFVTEINSFEHASRERCSIVVMDKYWTLKSTQTEIRDNGQIAQAYSTSSFQIFQRKLSQKRCLRLSMHDQIVLISRMTDPNFRKHKLLVKRVFGEIFHNFSGPLTMIKVQAAATFFIADMFVKSKPVVLILKHKIHGTYTWLMSVSFFSLNLSVHTTPLILRPSETNVFICFRNS